MPAITINTQTPTLIIHSHLQLFFKNSAAIKRPIAKIAITKKMIITTPTPTNLDPLSSVNIPKRLLESSAVIVVLEPTPEVVTEAATGANPKNKATIAKTAPTPFKIKFKNFFINLSSYKYISKFIVKYHIFLLIYAFFNLFFNFINFFY